MEERSNEASTQELILEFIENRDGRYVLIGPRERVDDGNALIFDSLTRLICGIDENDELHRSVVKRMLAGGASVVARTSDIPQLPQIARSGKLLR